MYIECALQKQSCGKGIQQIFHKIVVRFLEVPSRKNAILRIGYMARSANWFEVKQLAHWKCEEQITTLREDSNIWRLQELGFKSSLMTQDI